MRECLKGVRLRDDDPIFDVSPRTIDLWFQKASGRFLGKYEGRNPCRPHSLRAAFRTLLADAGMPVDEIRFFMGHRLPEQERVYMSRSRDGWRALYKRYECALSPENWRRGAKINGPQEGVGEPHQTKEPFNPELKCEVCGRKAGFDLPPFHLHHTAPLQGIYVCPWCHIRLHRERGDKRAAKLLEGSLRMHMEGLKQKDYFR